MGNPTVIWELTRACELGCAHCPKPAGSSSFEELTTYEAYKTVDEIASLHPRRLIMTGGDPLTRSDIGQVVDYARRRNLHPAVELVPTSHLTTEALQDLGRAGVSSLIFNLNGATARRHESLNGQSGSFDRTLDAMRWTRSSGIPFEVSTLLTRRTLPDLLSIANLIADFGPTAWNIHFVIPAGKARNLEVIAAAEAERIFEILAVLQTVKPFRIRTVEAPAYRRFLMQRTGRKVSDASEDLVDCTEGEVVFVSADGTVRPGTFLPLIAGNVRIRSLQTIVRNGDVFVAIRDRSNLTGKCGICEYREPCGGSRARAWVATGLLFSPDPLCAHQPATGRREAVDESGTV